MFDYTNGQRNIGVYYVSEKEDSKQKDAYKCKTEYKKGKGNCVCMFGYTYAGIRIIVIQIETGDRHRRRVMRTLRAP